MNPLFLAAAFLLAATAGAQQIWVVAMQGGNFSDLASAYAAAAPGDTILVRNGTYEPASTNKGVTVLCDANAFILSWGLYDFGVVNFPAGQTFVWRGGSYSRAPHTMPVFRIENCAGTVVIEDFTVGLVGQPTRIVDSSVVHFRSVDVTGPIEVIRSTATFADCPLRGIVFNANALSALSVTDATVAMSGGSVTSPPNLLVPTYAAVQMFGASRLDIGGATLVDGTPAVLGAPTNLLRHDPSVRFVSNGTVFGSIRVVQESVPSVASNQAVIGTVFTATVSAEPGSLTFTLLDTPRPLLRLPQGFAWLSPSSPVLGVGIVPPAGTLSHGLFVPNITPNVPFVLQAASLLTSGRITLGVPTAVTIR